MVLRWRGCHCRAGPPPGDEICDDHGGDYGDDDQGHDDHQAENCRVLATGARRRFGTAVVASVMASSVFPTAVIGSGVD